MIDKWFEDVEEIRSETYEDLEDEMSDSDEDEQLTVVDRNIKGTNRLVKFNQSIRVMGKSEEDGEFERRLELAKSKLTPVESKLFELVFNGSSVLAAGRKLKISKQRASKCWQNIKEKLR